MTVSTAKKGCYRFYDQIQNKDPGFTFVVRDLTSEYLPSGYEHDLASGQPAALSMAEYLKLVIPPTMAQEHIAPDRMAAHLMIGWESMVGYDVAERFSALAAFGVLDYRRINIYDADQLTELLDNYGPFLDGETPELRVSIRNGLLEMAEIMADTKIKPKLLAERAFGLIGVNKSIIGGFKAAERQMHGLLSHPAVATKVRDKFGDEPDDPLRAAGILELKTIVGWSGDDASKAALYAIYDALINPQINYDDMLSILKARRPDRRYDELKGQVLTAQFADAYQTARRQTELSTTESQLLYMHRSLIESDKQSEIADAIAIIGFAGDIVARAEKIVESVMFYRPSHRASRHIQDTVRMHLSRITSAQRLHEVTAAAGGLEEFIGTYIALTESAGAEAADTSAASAPASVGQKTRRWGSEQVTDSKKSEFVYQPLTPLDKYRSGLDLLIEALHNDAELVLSHGDTQRWKTVAQLMMNYYRRRAPKK